MFNLKTIKINPINALLQDFPSVENGGKTQCLIFFLAELSRIAYITNSTKAMVNIRGKIAVCCSHLMALFWKGGGGRQ